MTPNTFAFRAVAFSRSSLCWSHARQIFSSTTAGWFSAFIEMGVSSVEPRCLIRYDFAMGVIAAVVEAASRPNLLAKEAYALTLAKEAYTLTSFFWQPLDPPLHDFLRVCTSPPP